MRASITHVLGARTNFAKAAPVLALAALGREQRILTSWLDDIDD
jgi:hypothetical protein